VLPSGFHRIRHYGFLASPGRAATIDRLRELIAAADPGDQSPRSSDAPHKAAADRHNAPPSATVCPCCGGRMRVVETFARGAQPRSFTAEPAGIDSS
jgi:hypothetical protein